MADGRVSVEVTAQTEQFERNLRRSKKAAEDFDRGAGRSARNGGKRLNQTLKEGASEASSFSRRMTRVSDSAALLTGPLGGIASRLTIVGRAAGAGAVGLLAVSTSLAAITFGLNLSVKEAGKFETSFLRLEGVLKATGNSAGLTAEQIREMSSQIALSTLASVEGVEAASAKLLTFRSVQGEVFEDALRLAQDLAATGFGNIESAATSLGKALEDPEVGLTALTRSGVTFTAAQKEVIKQLIDTGKVVEAQRLILKQVDGQVGGVAESMSVGLAGAIDTLGQRYSEFLQAIGNLGPLKAATIFINGLAGALDNVNKNLLGFFDSNEARMDHLLQRQAELQRALKEGSTLKIDLPGLDGEIKIPVVAPVVRGELDSINQQIAATQKLIDVEKERRGEAKAAAAEEADRQRQARLEAKLLEERQKEAKRLAEIRKNTKRELREEIRVLTALSEKNFDLAASQREVERETRTLEILARNHLDATSKEGKAVLALINARNGLTDVLDANAAARERERQFQTDLSAINAEIEAVQLETMAIGQSKKVQREARVAAEAYRIEQEMLTAALEAQGPLNVQQRAQIAANAQELARAKIALEDFEDANEKALRKEQELTEKRLQFQETVADGIADLVFETDNLGDSFKRLILQMSRAIVEAKVLQAIQFAMGTDETGAVTGGGKTGGILGSIFQATVGAFKFHTGGKVGQGGSPVSVPVSTFIAAPRFHNGLKPDEFPAILQSGEEVVPKDQVGQDRQRGGGVVINVTTPDADSFRKSRRQISRELNVKTAKI